MAELPKPRALPQILGGMVDDYLSRLDTTGIAPGLKSLKPGSSILAFFESVAQSQARNSQDLMNVVNADDIDRAKGARLDRIGRKERVPRQGETYARGTATILDTRYQKVLTSVYAGKPAPIPGSTVVYVADASSFPATGQVYLGRGTSNYEGPLAYSARAHAADGYWTLTIPAGTTRFHNLTESVILAQGGDRVINVGQVVGTPQGNASDAVLYNTTQRVVLLDGDTEIPNVTLVAQQSGVIGNVSAGAIRYVQAPAFTGMAVTNPLPIQNGWPVEDDDHYRERIKAVRGNRSRATPDAILARAYRIQASDENSTITSAQLVVRPNRTSALFIDDGAAYEEKDAGVDYEVLIDSANGGETTFHLTYGRPVAKATLKSLEAEPYRLVEGCALAIDVGGQRYQHSFSAQDFVDIQNATAYEVVASINADSALSFNARTINGGTGIALFSRQDTNEDLTVGTPVGTDAAPLLSLPQGRVDTVRLYRNDSLLFKDGRPATITSSAQSDWSAMSTGETLSLDVDGTGQKLYTITDTDFVNAQTGVTFVSQNNSLEAWAKMLNRKVPGLTASVSGSRLVLTSNRGASQDASLTIDDSSTLVTKGMFDLAALAAQGRSNDYTLDRNLGTVELATPLTKGDRLSLGTPFTRAYLESRSLASTVTPLTDAVLWFIVDGSVETVTSGLDATQTLTLTTTSNGSTRLVRRLTSTYTGTGAAAYPFADVKAGDWLFLTDPLIFPTPFASTTTGAWRVSNVDLLGQWVEVDVQADDLDHTVTNAGTAYRSMTFVRSTGRPQKVTVPGGLGYTISDVVDTLNEALVGASASLYQNDRYRVMTNTYGDAGGIALVAQNSTAAMLGLANESSWNDLPHFAAVESQNSQVGTPPFFLDAVLSSFAGGYSMTNVTGLGNPRQGSLPRVTWLRPFATAGMPHRYGSNTYDTASLSTIPLSDNFITPDHFFEPPALADRTMPVGSFHLGPESTLSLVLDNDPLAKSQRVNLFRRLLPDPAVSYGTAMKFLDADNVDPNGNPQPLLRSFGSGFDFSNFVLYAHARGVTHSADSTRSVLWRCADFRNAEAGTVRYSLPTAPGQAVQVIPVEPTYDINIRLPSGAARAFRFGATSRLRAVVTSDSPATVCFIASYAGCSLSRSGTTVNCVPTLPAGVPSHGIQVGDIISLSSTDGANFPSGPKVVTWVDSTSFNYTEGGNTLGLTSYPTATVGWPSVNDNFVTGGLAAGDVLSLDGTVIPSVSGSFGITAVQPTWLKVYQRTGNTPADAYFHSVVNPQASVLAFPIDQSATGSGLLPPTAAWLVGEINAQSNALLTGTVAGSGSGAIAQSSLEEDIAGPDPSAQLKDGIVHIASATQDGVNFTLQTKYTVSGTYPDWANEEFRLVPTTAQNIVDFLNVPGVSGLTLAGGSVQASTRAGHIQLSSQTLGSESAIQVTGGTANAVRLTVQGGAQNVQNLYARVSVPASQDINEGLCQGQYVAIDGPASQPKLTGWNGSTTLGVAASLATLSSNAWSFSASRTAPVLGGRYYFERHGRFICITSADLAQTFLDVPIDNWLTVLDSSGTWSDGSSLADHPRFGAATVRLQDGRSLVIGGIDRFSTANLIAGQGLSQAGGTVCNDVDVYDPVTRTWSAAANYPVAIAWAAATVLNDGKVLVSGGITSNGNATTTACYIYNPSLNTWTATTGPLAAARARHTATIMSDGKVIALGGHDTTAAAALNSVELFDPAAGTWATLPNLAQAVMNHQTVRTGTDQLLVLGGSTQNGTALATVQSMGSYVSKTWTTSGVGALGTARVGCSCITLPSGAILVVGGSPANGLGAGVSQTEIYDPVAFVATSIAPLGWGRGFGSALRLASGKVLYLGGIAAGQGNRGAEVLDPATNTWSWLAGSKTAHVGPAFLNSNGTVTLAGATSDDLLTPDIATEVLDLTAAGPSKGNVGTFRVVATSQYSLWIENDSAVVEEAQGNLVFRTYQSVMPGDIIRIGSRSFGLSNQGDFSVSAVDLNQQKQFTVSGMSDFAPRALGTDAPLVQLVPAGPTRLVMKVAHVVQDPNDAALVSLFLVPGSVTYDQSDLPIDRINEASGCVVSALDKLDFPTEVVSGSDAYRYNTGLIAEANRVLYGDLRDRQTYPGYIAAGQVVDINAALVRRIQVRLAVRVRPGANVKSRIQNAVAKVINTAGPNPIALSDIIDAAKVDGVISVVLLSPTYDASHDTIPVQPYETPRVLDLNRDVQVSFIGS